MRSENQKDNQHNDRPNHNKCDMTSSSVQHNHLISPHAKVVDEPSKVEQYFANTNTNWQQINDPIQLASCAINQQPLVLSGDNFMRQSPRDIATVSHINQSNKTYKNTSIQSDGIDNHQPPITITTSHGIYQDQLYSESNVKISSDNMLNSNSMRLPQDIHQAQCLNVANQQFDQNSMAIQKQAACYQFVVDCNELQTDTNNITNGHLHKQATTITTNKVKPGERTTYSQSRVQLAPMNDNDKNNYNCLPATNNTSPPCNNDNNNGLQHHNILNYESLNGSDYRSKIGLNNNNDCNGNVNNQFDGHHQMSLAWNQMDQIINQHEQEHYQSNQFNIMTLAPATTNTMTTTQTSISTANISMNHGQNNSICPYESTNRHPFYLATN